MPTETMAKRYGTRRLRETLAMVRYLDGTRTIWEAARLAGIDSQYRAYSIVASLREVAAREPDLVRLHERREGMGVYCRAELGAEVR